MAKSKSAGAAGPGARVGMAALSLALAAAAQALVGQTTSPISAARQVTGWLLFALAGFLLHRASRPVPGAPPPQRERPAVWLEAAGVAVVLALALAVRLALLPVYPNAGFRDEGENGNVAIQLLHGERVDGTDQVCPVYIEHNTQNAAAYFYPVALSFRIFGISILSERYVSVFYGCLAVLAFWVLARAMLGPALGMFLAACLACMRWHVNFSRIGFLGIMTVYLSLPMLLWLWRGLREPAGRARWGRGFDLLLGVALALAVLRGFLQYAMDAGPAEDLVGLVLGLPLLYCAARAWKDRRARYLMLSMAALGFAMYSYIAARLLAVAVVAIVGQRLVARRGRPVRMWLPLILAGLLALLGVGLLTVTSALSVDNASWSRSAYPVLGMIPLLAAAALAVAFVVRRRDLLKGWVRPLALGLGVGLVVAGPVYAYALRHRVQVDARSYRVSIFNDHDSDHRPWGTRLLGNLGPTLGMVNVRGDGNPRHNLPGATMLDPLWAALFALGVFWALWNLGDTRAWLALALWQVSLVAGYASMEAPQAYRCITAIPAVLLLMGLALERVRAALRPYFGRDLGVASGLILAGVLFYGGALEMRTYFVDQRRDPGVWAEFSADEYLMGKDLWALNQGGERTRGLVLSAWADSYTFRFMTYPQRNYEPFHLSDDIPIRVGPGEQGENFLYILGEDYLPLVPVLEQIYPRGTYREVRHPYTHDLLYWTYFVPAGEVEKGRHLAGGLRGRYYVDPPARDPAHPEAAPHWVAGTRRIERVDPFILFNWTQTPIEGWFSASWDGTLRVPRSGTYDFELRANSYASLRIDGRKVVTLPFLPADRQKADGSVHLSAGRHALSLRYYDARGYARLELWWRPPHGDWAVVPSGSLAPGR